MSSYAYEYSERDLAILQALSRLEELEYAQEEGLLCAYDMRILRRCLCDLKRARQATQNKRWQRVIGRAAERARSGNFGGACAYLLAGLSQ